MAFVRTLDNKIYKDADGNRIDTTDWEHAPIELWNTTTLLAYVDHLNQQKFGKLPINRNIQVVRNRVKQDANQYGWAVLKRFVELAMADYGGSARFPTASYMQLRALKIEQFMAKAIAEVEANENATNMMEEYTVDEITNLF